MIDFPSVIITGAWHAPVESGQGKMWFVKLIVCRQKGAFMIKQAKKGADTPLI